MAKIIVVTENPNPNIMMMKPTQYRNRDNKKPVPLTFLSTDFALTIRQGLRRRFPGYDCAPAVLVRQLRGVTHRGNDGMTYGGRHYKSLSEVARAITGTRWSGPLFFGLTHRSKQVADG